MYNTNAGTLTNASTFDSSTAQASSTKSIPRYIGFRVTRYNPDTTSEDVACGVSGLIVVRARRNETTPATLMAMPSTAKQSAIARRAGISNRNAGTAHDANHISTATPSVTMGGGIFSSSAGMTAAPPISAYGRIRTYVGHLGHSGVTVRCVQPLRHVRVCVTPRPTGTERIELPTSGLEPEMIPLHQVPECLVTLLGPPPLRSA